MKPEGRRPLKAAIAVLGTAGAGMTGYEYLIREPAQSAVVINDVSKSLRPNCGGIEQATRILVEGKGMREGSRLTLLVIGDELEPLRLFDEALPFTTEGLYESDRQEQQAAREAFFRKFRAACDGGPANSLRSPILRAVKRGVEHLRRNCRGAECGVLVVRTDLREEEDSQLAPLVARAAKNPDVALTSDLAQSIDNTGITILFVGMAETSPQRRGSSAARTSPETLTRLFRGLFTHPELVSFQPYCGR